MRANKKREEAKSKDIGNPSERQTVREMDTSDAVRQINIAREIKRDQQKEIERQVERERERDKESWENKLRRTEKDNERSRSRLGGNRKERVKCKYS